MPRCGDLRIVDHERRIDVPPDTGARREMLFEVVGMQFDEARQQIVAVPVLGAGHLGRAGRDFANNAVLDPDHADESSSFRLTIRAFLINILLLRGRFDSASARTSLPCCAPVCLYAG